MNKPITQQEYEKALSIVNAYHIQMIEYKKKHFDRTPIFEFVEKNKGRLSKKLQLALLIIEEKSEIKYIEEVSPHYLYRIRGCGAQVVTEFAEIINWTLFIEYEDFMERLNKYN